MSSTPPQRAHIELERQISPSSDPETWSSKWGSSQEGTGSSKKLEDSGERAASAAALLDRHSIAVCSMTVATAAGVQPMDAGEATPGLLHKGFLQTTWHVLWNWPLRTLGVSLVLFLLLSFFGTWATTAAAKSDENKQREAALQDANDFASAFTNQLQEVNRPLDTIKMMVMANPSYSFWASKFDAAASEMIELVNTDARGSLEMLQVEPHGMSLLAYPPHPGLMDPKCTDILGYPDEAIGAFFKGIVAGGVATMLGPLVVQDYVRNVTYTSSAWVLNPVYISGVSKDDDFGYPWTDSPAAVACLEDGPCYNATTRTKWWGFATAFINFELLTTGKDARLMKLVEEGFNYRLVAPAGSSSLTSFLLGEKNFEPDGPDPVRVDVPVLAGNVWVLELQPVGGWAPTWRTPLIAVSIVVSIIVSMLVLFALVSDLKQTLLLEESREVNRQLAVAKDEADEGRRLVEAERSRMSLLLERQHDLINLVTQDGPVGSSSSKELSATERIEDLRKCLGDNARRASVAGERGAANAVQLLDLLGEGSFGKVYRGIWRQTEVAVKTMVLPSYMSGVEKREKMLIMEAAISSALAHPNIVQTYTYSISNIQDQHSLDRSCMELRNLGDSYSFHQSASQAGAPNQESSLDAEAEPDAHHHGYEVRLIIEYCNKGSLQDALEAKALLNAEGLVNYRAVLDMAMDIAKAMLHLHLADVLHGDLKCGNVLLKSSGVEGAGVVAKVADFGLAVKMDNMHQTHMSNLFQGTLTHMAPELLLYGRMSKAADVYAFGIALWELYTGERPFDGVPQALLGHQVAHDHKRPRFPAFPPAGFAELVAECWAPAPEHRPSFGVILQRLSRMRSELPGPAPPLSTYAAAAARLRKPGGTAPLGMLVLDAAAPRACSSKPIVLGSLSAYTRHARNQLTPVDEESAVQVVEVPARTASYKSEYIEMDE